MITKKYYYIFKNSIQQELAYRFHTFAVFFSEIFVFLFFFYLWSSIYRRGGMVGSYDQNGLISYYLLSMFLGVTSKFSTVGWYVGEEIKSGDLSKTLVKPFSFFYSTIAYNFAKIFYNTIIYSIIFGIIVFVLRDHLTFPESINVLIYFIVVTILGAIIYFLLSYIAGLGAFWLGFIIGINYAFQMVITFFDGSLIPLDLLPKYLKNLFGYLPFQYIVYTPVSIFSNRIRPDYTMVIIPIMWIFILFIFTRFIYNKGLKKYEGYGN